MNGLDLWIHAHLNLALALVWLFGWYCGFRQGHGEGHREGVALAELRERNKRNIGYSD
jgi:hypothetical protein